MTEEVKKGRGRSVAGMTAAAADKMRTNVDTRVKFKRENPRKMGGDVELNLYVPEGTIPEHMVGLWVPDDDKGSIQKKLDEWWGHVTDAQGVILSRPSGAGRDYLMAIEKEYKKELDELRERNYRASIGEDDRKGLGVDGVETYTPNGERNKIKITSDPFST